MFGGVLWFYAGVLWQGLLEVGGIVCSTLITLAVILVLDDYKDAGGMTCFRGTSRIDLTTSGVLCSTGVVPGSRLAVAISAASPGTTVPFGLAISGAANVRKRLADAPALLNCLMSGGNGVRFPIMNRLRMTNLSGGRYRRLVGGGIHPCVSSGRGPVIAMEVTDCHMMIANRIGTPEMMAIPRRGVDVVRTLTSTNSLAVCNGHRGIVLVHRSTRKRGRVRCLGLGSTGVVGSPCFCLRRGSIVCMRPGGIGTRGSTVNSTASL